MSARPRTRYDGGRRRLGRPPPLRRYDDMAGLARGGRRPRSPPRSSTRCQTPCISSWSAGSTSRPRRPSPGWPTGCSPPPRRAAGGSTYPCPGRRHRAASAAPPIDPDRLPEDELIRLAVGVLVHLLPGFPPRRRPPEPAGWPVPWRRRFRLHGSPGTVAAVRHGLLAQGLVETDWRPAHVVLARPVEVMMAEHWAGQRTRGGTLKWTTLWRRAEAAGPCPAASTSPRSPSGSPAGGASPCTWWSPGTRRKRPRPRVAAAPCTTLRRRRHGRPRRDRPAAAGEPSDRRHRRTGTGPGPRHATRRDAWPTCPRRPGTQTPPCRPPPFARLGQGAGQPQRPARSSAGWLRCARRSGRAGPLGPPAAGHLAPSTAPAPSRWPSRPVSGPGACREVHRDQTRAPARRRPEDRHVVRPGHPLHQP